MHEYINIHMMRSGVCYYDTKSRNQTLKRHMRNVGGVSVRSSAEACITRCGCETWYVCSLLNVRAAPPPCMQCNGKETF